jgi:hypothetical protein
MEMAQDFVLHIWRYVSEPSGSTIRELQTKERQHDVHLYINIYLFLTVISIRFVTPSYSVKERAEI